MTQQDLDNVDDAMDKLATASTATPENVAAAKTAFDKIKHTLSAADAKTVEKAFENYDIADSGAQKGKHL